MKIDIKQAREQLIYHLKGIDTDYNVGDISYYPHGLDGDFPWGPELLAIDVQYDEFSGLSLCYKKDAVTKKWNIESYEAYEYVSEWQSDGLVDEYHEKPMPKWLRSKEREEEIAQLCSRILNEVDNGD